MAGPARGLAAERSIGQTPGMLGTIARLALLRVLPRRLVPVLTAWQLLSMWRSRNRRSREAAARQDTRRR
jgi:hypothetical protein